MGRPKKYNPDIPIVEDSNKDILNDPINYIQFIQNTIEQISINHNIDTDKIIPSIFNNLCMYIGLYAYRKNKDLLYSNTSGYYKIDTYKVLKAYYIYKIIANNYNMAIVLDDFIKFININKDTLYDINNRISKQNTIYINNSNNTNIDNNIYISGNSSINNKDSRLYNNIDGWEGVTLRNCDLVQMINHDRLQSRVNRATSGKVAFVPELAVLNHDFNYSNNNNMEQKEQITSGSLPKLSLSDGQKDRYLSNDD